MGYSHTQKSPLGWILASVAAGLGIGAYALRGHQPGELITAAMTITTLFLAGTFAWLKVEDKGDMLRVRYGPLGVLGTKIPYASIKGVEPGRSAVIDGWGIHWVPWRGWTFNLWGRQCVAIKTDRGTIRVGTDDPITLARFLQSRVGSPPAGLERAAIRA